MPRLRGEAARHGPQVQLRRESVDWPQPRPSATHTWRVQRVVARRGQGGVHFRGLLRRGHHAVAPQGGPTHRRVHADPATYGDGGGRARRGAAGTDAERRCRRHPAARGLGRRGFRQGHEGGHSYRKTLTQSLAPFLWPLSTPRRTRGFSDQVRPRASAPRQRSNLGWRLRRRHPERRRAQQPPAAHRPRRISINHRRTALQHLLHLTALRSRRLHHRRWPACGEDTRPNTRPTRRASQTSARATPSQRHRGTHGGTPHHRLRHRHPVRGGKPGRPWRPGTPSPLPRPGSRPTMVNARDTILAVRLSQDGHLPDVRFQRPMAEVHLAALLIGLRRVARSTRPTSL